MVSSEIQSILGPLRPMGMLICASLSKEIDKLGLTKSKIPVINFDEAKFDVHKDPYTGEPCLRCDWFNERNSRLGSILFNPDGSFFAEYDVVHPHPEDERWFVEAVTAWGRDGVIKSEARLLPMT